jgi:hypothetical protein
MMLSHLLRVAREGVPCLLLFNRTMAAVRYKGFLQASTSHHVTKVTSSSSVRSIAGDADDVIFEGDDDVVVVGGGLAAVGADRERRQYHGTVDGVGGKAWMQKINGLPCAGAKIDGVEVGRGGGIIVIMVGGRIPYAGV